MDGLAGIIIGLIWGFIIGRITAHPVYVHQARKPDMTDMEAAKIVDKVLDEGIEEDEE